MTVGTIEDMSAKRPHLMLHNAFWLLTNGISGYVLSPLQLDEAMKNIRDAVSDPMLPDFEINEPFSVLSGRLDAGLFNKLTNELSSFRAKCSQSTDRDTLQ